ncbi:hypothetical protein niasHT_025163 [Heterodera trifolii]|uniref:Ubiquitin-like domain-containing protein n=1 Tax=Heterodera trifolii TaxID=157864 RepID=A0ABD2JLB1_9BILA
MNHFCFVGIYAVLAMLMLMLMPSSNADNEFKIRVKGDKNAIVYVKETDKVSTVKQKIVEELKESINEEIKILEAKLKSKNKIHKRIEKQIKVNEEIKIMEAKLEEKKNEKNKILTAKKTLRLNKNDSPLEDRKTIKEYVKNGETVFLALEGFEIFVQYKWKKYTIWVNNEDTVRELKEKVEKVIDIHHSEQKLTFQAEHVIVLKDIEKTVHSYNIGKGASLSLWRELQIGCQYKSKEYFPIVEETEKVSSVKEKVKEMINKKIKEENGIQLKNITLEYGRKELEDDKEIGCYDGIESKLSTVYVINLEQKL